jgi:hypothetical protein
MLRIGWRRTEATLIDRVHVRDDAFQSEMGGRTRFQVWDHLVELDDGTRLVIRERSFEVELPPLGRPVPVLVNRRRTKAAFDLDDPAISTGARMKLADARREERRKEKRARFDERRRDG